MTLKGKWLQTGASRNFYGCENERITILEGNKEKQNKPYRKHIYISTPYLAANVQPEQAPHFTTKLVVIAKTQKPQAWEFKEQAPVCMHSSCKPSFYISAHSYAISCSLPPSLTTTLARSSVWWYFRKVELTSFGVSLKF